MTEPLEITFGYPSNGFAYEGTGWSNHEPEGAWMLGEESTLILPRPGRAGDYLLELALAPAVRPGCDFQRLSVQVNGVGVCNQVVRGETLVQCWVPWSVLGGPAKSLVLLAHPDAWSPSDATGGEGDRRVLSLFVRRVRLSLLTERAWAADHLRPEDEAALEAIVAAQQSKDGLAMHTLMLDFASLGSNCEFGMVQRHHRAEPLGLFRFSYTPLAGLVAAMEGGLGDVAGQAELALDPLMREYEMVDRAHGFRWHTYLYEGQVAIEGLEARERTRLSYLARRLQETLEEGDTILVVRDEDGPSERGMVDRLLAALRRHGNVTLLWVSVAADGREVGDVEWAGEGLLHGWVDRLTRRLDAVDASMAAWGVVCQRAHVMWLARRGG